MLNKIKGAMYGFAIGDAMGATTEFLSEEQIKNRYGKVDNIVGGGWLNLKQGEVTDDTQMMLCVCNAIEQGSSLDDILTKCCKNFSDWYDTFPKDIGGCCRRIISYAKSNIDPVFWQKVADDSDSLGNGSLMRTMPMILSGQDCQAAMSQGRLTHNNKTCDFAISTYYENMVEILEHDCFRNVETTLYDPSGHVLNTLSNALFWTQNTDSFEDAIVGAVNHGGDADTIAAITGSLVGALYGYDAIPKRWVDSLDENVRSDLEKYSKLFTRMYVQNKGKMV